MTRLLAAMRAAPGKAGLPAGRPQPPRSPEAAGQTRAYNIHAVVTAFSLPVVARAGVGGALIAVQETAQSAGRTVLLQLAAGSFPERAQGLNRLGFLRELVQEEYGAPVEASYFGLMTVAEEANLDQATLAVQRAPAAWLPYALAWGAGIAGGFRCGSRRTVLPAVYTWLDYADLFDLVAAAEDEAAGAATEISPAEPRTFLYCLWHALRDRRASLRHDFVHNSRRYVLTCQKSRDEKSAHEFAARGLIPLGGQVVRLNGSVQDEEGRGRSRFRLWFEPAGAQCLPIRFEFRPRSFLRLVFEAAPMQRIAAGRENL